MRFISALLLALLLCSPAFPAEFHCKNGKRPVNYVPIEERYTKGLLFKIGKCGKSPNFILGTVHSDHPKVRKAVYFAEGLMQQAAAVGFEYVEPENMGAIIQKYLIGNPEKREAMRDVLETPLLKRTTSLLQRFMGMQPSQTRMFKPWAAAVMLQYPAQVADGKVLDMYLQHLAKEQRIPLFGVETMEQQFQIFDGLPMETQVNLLRETIANIDQIDDTNEALLNIYVAEDLRAMMKLAEKETARIKDESIRLLFTKTLLEERNNAMAKRLYPEFVKGGRFFAVGALHLMGKKGLLKRLEELGYLIQPLSAETGDAQKP